jgi:hypothetical protein
MAETGESEYSGALKTPRLLIFRHAKNAEHGKTAANWNVFGTRTFQPARRFREKDSFSSRYYVSVSSDLGRLLSSFPESRLRDRCRARATRTDGHSEQLTSLR